MISASGTKRKADGEPQTKHKRKQKKQKTSHKKPIIEPIRSKQEAKKKIQTYHELQHKLDKLNTEGTDKSETEDVKKKIEKEMEEMGGIRAYQDACVYDYNFRKDKHNIWIVNILTKHGIKPAKSSGKKLHLLDVGSLSNFFFEYKDWMTVEAIDISPRHPSVKKIDFLEMDMQQKYLEKEFSGDSKFDVVVMGLVLNFVGESKKRGEMILRSYKLLREGGFLFITLPISCVNHSKFLTHKKFCDILSEIGFVEFPERRQKCEPYETASKLAFYCLKKEKRDSFVESEDVYPFGYRGRTFVSSLDSTRNKGRNSETDTRVDFGIDVGNNDE